MLGEIEERLINEIKQMRKKIMFYRKMGYTIAVLGASWCLYFLIKDLIEHNWGSAIIQGTFLGINSYNSWYGWRRLDETL